MKTIVLAMFLGAIQGRHHHSHHHTEEDCSGLCAEYKQKYLSLLAKQNEFTKELHGLENRFLAEGYGNKENLGEKIKVNGEDERQLPVKYIQREFAEGYGDREQMGETIKTKNEYARTADSAMVKHSYA